MKAEHAKRIRVINLNLLQIAFLCTLVIPVPTALSKEKTPELRQTIRLYLNKDAYVNIATLRWLRRPN